MNQPALSFQRWNQRTKNNSKKLKLFKKLKIIIQIKIVCKIIFLS